MLEKRGFSRSINSMTPLLFIKYTNLPSGEIATSSPKLTLVSRFPTVLGLAGSEISTIERPWLL